MKHGLSLFVRHNPIGAFEGFQCGFAMLPETLTDDRPMSLALFLMVLCELSSDRGYSYCGRAPEALA